MEGKTLTRTQRALLVAALKSYERDIERNGKNWLPSERAATLAEVDTIRTALGLDQPLEAPSTVLLVPVVPAGA